MLVLLCVVGSIVSPYFANQNNLTNVLGSVAIIGTMSAVMTLVLVSGALDLSVGSIVGLTGIVAAVLMAEHGTPAPLAALVALVVGGGCGLFNALCVVRLRINPIIVTIGTLALFRGLAFILSDGRDIAVGDPFFETIGFERWLFLPVTVWIMLAVFAAAWWVARWRGPVRDTSCRC